MALFSRRPKDHDPADDGSAPDAPAEEAPAAEAAPRVTEEGVPAAPAPQVGISLTSFDGFGAGEPVAAEPADVVLRGPLDGGAPPASETIPGLPDNVLLRDALAALGDDPETHEILNVARQLLQGNLYLRVKGDAQRLLAAGEELPLAVATREDGNFVLVYSGGIGIATAVEDDGDDQTSAMGQAAREVLEYVLHGEFAGLIVDHASAPASVVLPRTLIERALAETPDGAQVKALLAAPRTDDTPAAIVEALIGAPLWVAVNRPSEDADWGVAESRTPEGGRVLEVFSHPLEVVALGRGDQPAPLPAAQLGTVLATDEDLEGIVLDPGGPWLLLRRAQLGPLIALAGQA